MLENLKSLKYLPTVYRDSSQRLRTDLQARIEAAGLRARPVFAELMTALTLLHHGMVNKRKSGRQYPEFTSVYGHEVATLNFADQFGFKFLGRDKQSITVLRDQVRMTFEYIELRRIQVEEDFLTVLVTKYQGANSQSKARVFCLGLLKTVLPLLC